VVDTPLRKTGLISVDGAKIYYETAGEGPILVMIHAGVADSRQWNNEFAFFAQHYHVLRYDMRGYGNSEPVEGEYSHLSDLVALFGALNLHEPLIIMGCSMGGGLAMDFALAYPSRMRALIMVDSGPSGLKLDIPASAKFKEVEKAFEAGDLDRVAELEAQIWFDGTGRSPEQVNPGMRKLLIDMDRKALAYEVRQLGKRVPDTQAPAFDRLEEMDIPVMVIVGAHDTPFSLAAADYMVERIRFARKLVIQDAAHLPNLDQPLEFQRIVKSFLESHSI
jgi:pimeloyl-ACP methyl ester carboxylesterase